MELTEIYNTLDSIDFLANLYDPYRNKATGRTRLLVLATIKISIKNPLQNISFHDHDIQYNDGIDMSSIHMGYQFIRNTPIQLIRDNKNRFCFVTHYDRPPQGVISPIIPWRSRTEVEIWEQVVKNAFEEDIKIYSLNGTGLEKY